VQRVFQRQQQVCEAAQIQFIKGVDEPTVPEVALKRNRNGTAGTAIFVFENPSIFQASSELGDITGVCWEWVGVVWGSVLLPPPVSSNQQQEDQQQAPAAALIGPNSNSSSCSSKGSRSTCY
jgi:hypothetical protein